MEGAHVHQTNDTVPCASAATSSSTNNQPYYKAFGNKKESTFNVKVVKAAMNKLPNGKVEFEWLEQTHISLNERSANVHTMTNAVQSKW